MRFGAINNKLIQSYKRIQFVFGRVLSKVKPLEVLSSILFFFNLFVLIVNLLTVDAKKLILSNFLTREPFFYYHF